MIRFGIQIAVTSLLWIVALGWPHASQAQGGPPFLTNDPGTPGNDNWEINIAAMPVINRAGASYQVPQFDINFGIGDRIQLTYEVPFVVQSNPGEPVRTGWGNALPGVKWRFIDRGEGGWKISTFPQIETSGTMLAQKNGIAAAGPRFLLPLEISKQVGPLDLNFEVGYYFPWHGPQERIIGFAAGRQVTPRLELDGEIYNDRAMGALPHDTTYDFGGRYKLHQGFLLLFMAGRDFRVTTRDQPQFIGYFGVQILLSDYGRTLTPDQ